VGTWRFQIIARGSYLRTFHADGTISGDGFTGTATWKIAGSKILIDYPDKGQGSLSLPLDPKGTKGLTHDREEVIAVKIREELPAGSLQPGSNSAPEPPRMQPAITSSATKFVTSRSSEATIERPFENTLGMRFVPVPITGGPSGGQRVLFSIWETRVQDYEVFVKEKGVERPKPQFAQGPWHPVASVSWNDANAFCEWLTTKENADGKLPNGMKYRLPTDDEWSRAVGLANEQGATPKERSGKNSVDFPWGSGFPPPWAKAGNYAEKDGHDKTSPVGSFEPNVRGIYDMGGNVWEWCEDLYEPGHDDRVLRGASWGDNQRGLLLSSNRFHGTPGLRSNRSGFRVVVSAAGPAPISPGVRGAPVPAGEPVKVQPAVNSSATKPVTARIDEATTERPFENGLGMRFVPVPITGGPSGGQRVLFSVWETRVQDYEVYVREKHVPLPDPGFPQDATHPVANVTWDEAKAFCAWLTVHDRSRGRFGLAESYRLPTDHEWSCAVGIGGQEDPAKPPQEKIGKIADVFPWGSEWPPPNSAGNYSGEEATVHKKLKGRRDDFPFTAPAGSFAADRFGLHDLGGNVWEWCEDSWGPGNNDRVARGASWINNERHTLLSSNRAHGPSGSRYNGNGFRVVLAAAPAR